MQKISEPVAYPAHGDEPIEEVVIGPDNEAPDEDGDSLLDNEEDINGNGEVDPGETDPKNPDTDGDGIRDDVERRSGTDPTRADSDGDGINDGVEDRNQNGEVDGDETDPKSADSDGDGLADGAEDKNGDGERSPGETDPNNSTVMVMGAAMAMIRSLSTETMNCLSMLA